MTGFQAALVFALASIFATAEARAFTLASSTNSDLKGWAGADVKIALNLGNCPSTIDVEGIVGDAAAVWNDVATSRLKVSVSGTSTGTTPANPPILYCETNFQSVTGQNQNYVPAVANTQSSTANGMVAGAIILNVSSSGTARITNVSRAFLTIVLAHEIGHLIGLGHSQSSEALMYYDGSKKTSLSLSQDDVDGVSYLYPRNEPGDGFGGCSTVAGLPGPGSPGGPRAALLMAAFPIVLALRLKRRARSAA